jgi:tRNA(fMet)-specific endonuclease VapC
LNLTYLLDTSVAIEIRDHNSSALTQLADLVGQVVISAITRVELEGGVYRDAQFVALRRQRLDVFLAFMPVVSFETVTAERYGRILAAQGFSRRKILDRMIGAQALGLNAKLITLNPDDFCDIDGLEVVGW